MTPPPPANVRVLVRVRPLNKSELTERGSIGRSNVLNFDTKPNGNIDFNEENNKENGSTLVVNPVNSSEDNNRRATTGDFRSGYSSDGDANNAKSAKHFLFDAVHGPRSTQHEVYDSVKGIVDAVTAGYNGTIVAYGQTGSGKTHTVFGNGGRGDEAEAGLIQRSLRDIFVKVAQLGPEEKERRETVFLGSFFEIFNERVYDLISSETLSKTLAVREDKSGVYVEGLKEVPLMSAVDAEDLLAKGLANRQVASTNMNRSSSRSHAVFVLSVKTEHVTLDGMRKVRQSKFTLVDLAGSERQKSTAAIGMRLKEASMINKSLLCLGHVINALVDKEHGKARHVPFRNSKLTFLLKDTWGGNSKTCLVATVSPSASSQAETISTLTFAQRAKLIKNTAILNEDTCSTVAALQAEVAKLRSKLQNSSSVVVEKIVHQDETTDSEMMQSLKRRNERAESKVAELEKMISDEHEVVVSLKRKIHEEQMCRKFKERRLDYLQKRHFDASEADQTEILNLEILSLRKRLDAPSSDAIEWRIAYEEAKEALENKIQEVPTDLAELEKRKTQLEETVDRLCAEKLELEAKIADLSESSNETREEIESIMNDVDNLEREMVSCQKQLRIKTDECKDYEDRTINAEMKVQEATSAMEATAGEKLKMEIEISGLQSRVDEYADEVANMNSTLERKNHDLLELEETVKETETELKRLILDLEAELEASSSSLAEKDRIIVDLEERLSNALKGNEQLGTQLQETTAEIAKQKNAVTIMEKKVTELTAEKQDALNEARENSNRTTADMAEQLLSLEKKISELSAERQILESSLLCEQEKAEVSSQDLLEKQAAIQSLQAKIDEALKERHGAERKWKDDLSKLEACTAELSSKLVKAVDERDVMAKSIQDEKTAMREKLDSEIRELKDNLSRSDSDRELLENNLSKSKSEHAELVETIKILMDAIQDTEKSVIAMRKEKKDILENASRDRMELESNIKECESTFKAEKETMIETLNKVARSLEQSNDEKDDLSRNLKAVTLEVEAMKNNARRLEFEKKTHLMQLENEKENFVNELKELTTLRDSLQQSLEEKKAETFKLVSANSELQSSLERAQKERAANDDLVASHASSLERVQKEKEALLSELHQCKEDIENTMRRESDGEQERQELKKVTAQYKQEASEYEAELSVLRIRLDKIEGTNKINLQHHEVEIGELRSKLVSIETDRDHLKTLNLSLTSSAESSKDDLLKLRDRFTMIERRNDSLEFELDTLQEDHNALIDQVHHIGTQNKDLRSENIAMKKIIDDMRNNDGYTRNSSSGSTWDQDTRLSFDNSNETDSVVGNGEKGTQNMETPASPSEDDDNSFDESLFLPNIESQSAPLEGIEVGVSKDECGDDESLAREELSTTRENKVTILVENKVTLDKENIVASSPAPFYPTPTKSSKSDYGKRRVPLSERKENRTPLTSHNKRLKSSTKKFLSSSKKPKTNFMVFNNNKLFG